MHLIEVLLLAVILSIVAGLAWYARAIAPFVPANRNVPAGIGGWLIIPAITLAAGPIFLLLQLMVVAQYVLPAEVPGSLRYTYILANSVAAGAMGAFAIYVAFQFFSRSRLAPRLFIALSALGLIGGVLFLLLDAILFDAPIFTDETNATFFVGLLSTSVWIPYFYVSARVRNTFTR